MTTLSPSELDTVTRFGMFDDDTIEMHERFLDHPAECALPDCVKAAAWRISMRCCGAAVNLCEKHHPRVVKRMIRQLYRAGNPECLTCDHLFPVGSSLGDVARVVNL